ncbi:MAG: aldo/keto reductase [Candidatus Hydrogenedentes bacterium]|nr:aldo/keto reductase [Candidatus Hydrogenedentota bacterium]
MTMPDSLPEVEWRGERVSRIILGTAQLGMNYGVANVDGQPDPTRAREIVQAAWEAGIRHFDTAQSYGTSEAMLGRALRELGIVGEARVASKLALPADPADVRTSIARSFERLGVERLWCMMLHHPRHLDEWDGPLGEMLEEHRRAGRIEHLGVSLSPLEDAPRCLAHPAIEVLQLPCNAWDRRPMRLGIIDNARKNGQLCCVRSIYLQGLLTMSPESIGARLPAAEGASRAWHAFAASKNMSTKELAVRFGMTLGAPLVIGAETPEQIRATIALARRGPLLVETIEELAATIDPLVTDDILEPWRWPPIK